jgi:4-amino-4-deoxy-L-arabinose transferase-like glycosyltransferase
LTRNQWIAAGLALFAVYACLATWFHFDFGDVMGYYSMFAEALLNGRLYLDLRPDQVQLMDMIPYQGRYYLQWGPTPGLFHFVPRVFGVNLSDRMACLLAGWISSLLFLQITLLLRRRHFPTLPQWVCLMAFWMFALGSPAALVVLRPTIYNESIAVAAVGFVGALAAFLRFQEQPNAGWALLCGLGVSLAFTTRITLAIYAVMLFLALAAVEWMRKQRLKPAALHLAAYALPVLVGIGVQLAYNQGRFGSPWSYFPEYNPETATFLPVFTFDRIPENIRHYLLSLPELSNDFPWVAHRGWQPIEKVVRAEAMSSMFLGTPVLLLGLLAVGLFRPKANSPADLKLAVGVAAASGLAVFAVMLMFHSASRRYMHDFLPMLLVVAFVGTASLWKQGANWGVWRAPALVLLLYMAVFHAHLAFMHSFVSLPSDLNVVRAVADFSPLVRRVLPGPNLDREEAVARNDIGTMYLRQRRFRQALAEFERAEALMPGSEVIQKNVRLAQRLAGRSDSR